MSVGPLARVLIAGLVFCGCSPGAGLPGTPTKGTGGPGDETGPGTDETDTGSDTGETGEDADMGGGGDPPTDFNYAFVSSSSYVAGELGSLMAADQRCQALADAASLGGQYVAWLSSSTVDAKSRIAGARGWHRTDGRPFVDQVSDLIAGRISYPLRLDEFGEDRPDVLVLTATDGTGVKVNDADSGTCSDWTSADPAKATSGGVSDAGDELWTQWDSLGLDCGGEYHLYCLGIDNDEPGDFDPAQGRVAFVTAEPFVASSGLDVADAQCQQEASQAGHEGQFLALMATDAIVATQRFDLQGQPWIRPDGVALVEKAQDLSTAILAPLVLDADGFTVSPRLVWTGAADLGAASVAESCTSWSTLAGTGRAGLSSRSDGTWHAAQLTDCDAESVSLYCFEN